MFVKVFRSEILSDFRRLGILSGCVGCRPRVGRCGFGGFPSARGAVPVGGCVSVVVVEFIVSRLPGMIEPDW
jgi:hypothetical protein